MAATPTSTRSRGPGRAVLWGLAALGLLAAVALVVEPQLGQRAGQPVAGSRQLVDEAEVRRLVRITVRPRGAPPFTVTRPAAGAAPGAEPGPTLTPPGVGADAAAVGALFSALQAEVLRRVPLPAGTEARYGLAAPRLELHWPDGAGLQLGDATADGGVYARRRGAPELLVVDAAAVAPLFAPAERYRSRSLFRTPLRDAGEVALPTLTLSRKREGWLVREPGPGAGREQRTEAGAVRALLERLDALQAASRVEPRRALPVTPPPLTVRVDGRVRLQGGWPCPQDAAARWLHRDDGEDLCVRADDGLLLLSPTVASLLPARLGRFPAAAISRVVREPVPGCTATPPPREELQREAGWRLVQPAATPLERAAAERLVAALSSLVVERWLSPTERAAVPLQPQLRLRIEARGDTQRLELDFPAPLCPRGGASPEPRTAGCLARSDEEPGVAVLTDAICAALAGPLPSRSLLALDEARLLAVEHRGGRGAGGSEVALPLGAPAVRAALRGLTEAARVEYGLPPGTPRAILRIEHGPPPTAIASDEVAPREQEIRLYGPEPLRAVRSDRPLTYTLSPAASRAVAELLAAGPPPARD
ncbi:MAG: DUF4340 domain-containing protein [Polyangia bacterium]